MINLTSGKISINLEIDLLSEVTLNHPNQLLDVIQLLEVIERLKDLQAKTPSMTSSILTKESSILEKAKLPVKAPRKPRKPKDGVIVTMIPPIPPLSQHQASEYIEEELEEEI
jgi:hypothetical protein